MKKYFSYTLVLQFLAGVLFALASTGENSLFCLVAVVFTAVALTLTLKKSKSTQLDFYVFGVVFYGISQYWIADTINYFGGFPLYLSYLLLLLYVLLSSLQFVLCVWIFKQIKLPILVNLRIAFPLAWFLADLLYPKMFPWSMIHPLISFKYFSILAAIFGSSFLTFLFLWAVNLLLTMLTNKAGRKASATLLSLLLAILSFLSVNLVAETNSELNSAQKLKVALVQANIPANEIINSGLLGQNLSLYQDLSLKALEEDPSIELLVWPESSANFWTSSKIENVKFTKFDPFPQRTRVHVYGGMSFEEKATGVYLNSQDKYLKYNTAFVVDSEGRIQGKYHKRILMPFGEYLPFAKTFPFIKTFSPETGDLDRGEIIEPISISIDEKHFKLGVLICYEDLVSSLYLENVEHGANLLVNITNDAWYGKSPAATQHNLLASWGAIESGRFLLRATNTGLTSVVNPYGEMQAMLPRLQQGVLSSEIAILNKQTPFVKYGRIFTWSILIAVLFSILSKLSQRGSDVSKE